MGEQTAISWCNHTFNPWIGCTKVSVGEKGACVACYAEASTPSRALGVQWGDHPRHRTAPSTWAQPLAWNRKAEREGTRPFVFCASLADVFDNQVDPAWRADLFSLIRKTPNLVWLLLTKRPQNIVKLFNQALMPGAREPAFPAADRVLAVEWPRNAAIGCTIVTQAEADRDIPLLLAAKASLDPAFAFVSMEPLMEAVDIAWALSRNRIEIGAGFLRRGHFSPGLETLGRLDWVITGGETDHGSHRARPSHPDWFRSLRDQCAEAAVPFHFKQWGEWTPGENVERQRGVVQTAHRFNERWDLDEENLADTDGHIDDEPDLYRVGKKAAGRHLGGVLHDARPQVRSPA